MNDLFIAGDWGAGQHGTFAVDNPATTETIADVSDGGVDDARRAADIGPLVSQNAVDEINSKLDEAIAAGARIAHRVTPPADANGYFLAPQIVVDVPADARLVTEEIFGPVAPIVIWTDEQTVIDAANGGELGLAAYVYSRDLQRAIRIGEELEAGMVGINRGIVSDPSAPFGGMKQSGLGREGARDGLAEFQETQYLSVAW